MTTGLEKLRHLFWEEAPGAAVRDGLDPGAQRDDVRWDETPDAACSDGMDARKFLGKSQIVDVLNHKNAEFERKALHRD